MASKIQIPTPLRPYTDEQDAVDVEGATVGELLADLTTARRAEGSTSTTSRASCGSFVNVYVNDEDIRYLQKEQTPVGRATRVSIIPSMAGGAPAATASEPPTLPELTDDEVRRYSRHLIMPEVGMDGQKRSRRRSVLLIGAGGLGSPLALYLAAAGVGTHRPGRFRRRRLQQPAAPGRCTARRDVGRPKLRLGQRPAARPSTRTCRSTCTRRALTSANALELFAPYDIIIDGTDNFPTRYLVNDACVLLGKPNVYGSIFRFDGQASVFCAAERPVLSLPVSRAAAARRGAELRRGRRAGHPAGPDRLHPGDRGGQADPRHRRAADRPAAALRRACR